MKMMRQVFLKKIVIIIIKIYFENRSNYEPKMACLVCFLYFSLVSLAPDYGEFGKTFLP